MSETAKTIFSPELAARFDKLVTLYPLRRSALVPMLLYAQDEVGYVSDAVVAEIARRIEISRERCAQRVELLLHAADQARRQIQHSGLHQYLLHVARRLRAFWSTARSELGIGHKEVTPDGLFSLEEVECIGACCWAPAVQVNYDFHDELTPEKMDQILDDYKAGRGKETV